MNILDKIILNKKREVKLLREQTDFSTLEKSRLFSRETFSLSDFIINPARSGIIAEFKRESPSAGKINSHSDVQYVTQGYSREGASALSILTDKAFFGGKCADVMQARIHNHIPILRKEFIIDEIQVLESKAIGADAILLIASVLDKAQILKLASLAHSLKMEVLLEVGTAAALDDINEYVNIVGVNNRDLQFFTTNVSLSFTLADKIPAEFVKISESGISNTQTVIELREAGYNGFLVGEYFMNKPDPVTAFADFVNKINENARQNQG